MKFICQTCGAIADAHPCLIKSGRKKYCSLKCRNNGYKISMLGNKNNDSWSPINENNPNWKGDSVTYIGIHAWVVRHLGRPMCCSKCGTTSYHRYEWHNISGEYKRDLSDWVRLCVSCHRKIDNKYNKAKICDSAS